MANNSIFIERINNVPINEHDFSDQFQAWLYSLTDALNSAFDLIESNINTINQFVSVNGISVPQFTTAEITVLAVTAPNGTFWYDTTTNQIKAKSNGIVVVVV